MGLIAFHKLQYSPKSHKHTHILNYQQFGINDKNTGIKSQKLFIRTITHWCAYRSSTSHFIEYWMRFWFSHFQCVLRMQSDVLVQRNELKTFRFHGSNWNFRNSKHKEKLYHAWDTWFAPIPYIYLSSVVCFNHTRNSNQIDLWWRPTLISASVSHWMRDNAKMMMTYYFAKECIYATVCDWVVKV